MSDALGGPVTTGPRHRTTLAYTRVVALLLLGAGLQHGWRILGMVPGAADFAAADPARQAGAVTLLCVDLFAAVGLWIGATWGPVMWAVAFVVEISMHTIFAHLFGADVLRVLLHGAFFGTFLVLSILDWRRDIKD